MSLFITGASGFIGRAFVQLLEQQARPFQLYSGRINDPLQLRRELPGVETVVHLAGAERHGRVRLVQHVDVEGTQRLVEECQRAGVQRIITVSRIGADANSIFPLLRAKGEQERILRNSSITYTVLRTATLFGQQDRFLNVIASLAAWTWPFVWLPGAGSVALQPLWVQDFVRCLLATVDRVDLHNQTVELAGEERFRYAELVHLVTEAAGLRRKVLPVHLRIVRPVAMMTLAWWRTPPVSRFFLNRFSVPDIAALDAVLRWFGFRPARLAEHLAYLRRPGLRGYLFRH